MAASTAGAFLAELRKREVGYCVLRGYDQLPDYVSHDLDIALLRADLAEFERALRSVALRHGLVIQTITKHSSCFQYRLCDPGRTWRTFFQVDAHLNGEGYRGARYASSEEIVAASTDNGVWRQASAQHDAASRLFTSLLGCGRVREKHWERIQELVARSDEDFFAIVRRAFGSAYGALLAEALRLSSPDMLSSSAGRARRHLLQRWVMRGPSAWLSLARFWVMELKVISQRTGVFICFLGPDGVGKTTVAREVASRLRWAFGREVVYFHGRPPLFGRMPTDVPYGGGDVPRVTHRVPGVRFVRLGLSYLRVIKSIVLYHAGFVLRVLPRLHREYLVVADRYYYEYFLNPDVMEYYASPRFARWGMRWVPAPDLVVVAAAPPEVVHSRKQELSVIEIARQNAVLEGLAGSLGPERCLRIDTSRPLQDVVDAVCSRVLDLQHQAMKPQWESGDVPV